MTNIHSNTTSKIEQAQAFSHHLLLTEQPPVVKQHQERFAQSRARSLTPIGKILPPAEIERYCRLPASAADTSVYESVDLVLIRGLPGSGKSTIARSLRLVGYHHFEADMYFEVDGKYTYDVSRIRDAHQWCQNAAREALRKNLKVVVSNTFTRLQELEPYLKMTDKIHIVEAQGNWINQHDVPTQVIRNMAARWEWIEPSTKISNPVIH